MSRNVADVANTIKQKILPEVRAAMEERRCAATTDMWTDDYKKRCYITVTVHYINDEWDLKSRVLFTCGLQSERKTGSNIRRELHRMFEKTGVSEEMLVNVIFVTDQGANIMNALQGHSRFDCSAHVLNTVLRNTFDNYFLEKEASYFKEAIELVKATVTYLKQTGLASQLKRTVHQEVPTRWNSKLQMLISVYEQFEEIQSLLEARNCTFLDQVSKKDVQTIIDFLQPFKEATDSLERDKCPTLPLVLLHLARLRKHLCEDSSVEPALANIKVRAESFLERKLKLGMAHKVATFLLPQFRQLRMIPEEEREEVYAHVRDTLAVITVTSSNSHVAGSELVTTAPCAKRRCAEEFQEWCDRDDGVSATYDEVDEYLRCGSAVADEGHPDHVLCWWKSNEQKLPKLTAYARRILCIPATSANVTSVRLATCSRGGGRALNQHPLTTSYSYTRTCSLYIFIL